MRFLLLTTLVVFALFLWSGTQGQLQTISSTPLSSGSYVHYTSTACATRGQTVAWTINNSGAVALDVAALDPGNYTLFTSGSSVSVWSVPAGESFSYVASAPTSVINLVVFNVQSGTGTFSGSAYFLCNGPLLGSAPVPPALPASVSATTSSSSTVAASPTVTVSATVTSTVTTTKTATASTTITGTATVTHTNTLPVTVTNTLTETAVTTYTNPTASTETVFVTGTAVTETSSVPGATVTFFPVTVTVTASSKAADFPKADSTSLATEAHPREAPLRRDDPVRPTFLPTMENDGHPETRQQRSPPSPSSTGVPITSHRVRFTHNTTHEGGAGRARSSPVTLGNCPLINYSVGVTISGTPYQMILDTGSGFPALAGSTCSSCSGVSPLYSPGASAISLGFPLTLTYGSGSFVANSYFETLTLGAFTVPNVLFGSMTSQSGMFSSENCGFATGTPAFQGILGMAYGATLGGYGENPSFAFPSFTESLGQYFALQLCESGGRMWFNSSDPTQYTSGPNPIPVINTATVPSKVWYTFTVGAVTLGSTTITSSLGNTILDSGTNGIVLPSSAYTTIVSQLQSNGDFLAAFPSWSTTTGFQYCVAIQGGYTSYKLNALLPTLSFTINGITYSLTAVDGYIYVGFQSGTPLYCFGIRSTTSSPSILGIPFMSQHVSFFDLPSGYIGLAPSTACQNTWTYTGWSTCSGTCGLGTQTRTGTCYNYLGQSVSGIACHTTPILSQVCQLAACTVTSTATAVITSTATTTSTSTYGATATTTVTATSTTTTTATATSTTTLTTTQVPTVTETDTVTPTSTLFSTGAEVVITPTVTVTVRPQGSGNDSGATPGAIAGAIIGTLAGVALLGVVGFYAFKHFKGFRGRGKGKDVVEMGI